MWKLIKNVQRLLNKHALIIFFKNEKPIISISVFLFLSEDEIQIT